MVRPFANSTLMDVLLKKLEKSNIPNKNIYLAVHEPELLSIGKKYPFNIFKRSKKSAMSEGHPISEVFEWWDKIPFKNVVMINACCPFLKVETIERFFSDYLHLKEERNGLFAVIKKNNYFWSPDGKILTEVGSSMNTKEASFVYEAAHVLYAGLLQDIGNNRWMGDLTKQGDVIFWEIDERECLDIDHEWQFEMCNTLYQGGFHQ